MFMYIAYIRFLFGSYVILPVRGGQKWLGGDQGNKGTVLRENGKYSYRSFF